MYKLCNMDRLSYIILCNSPDPEYFVRRFSVLSIADLRRYWNLPGVCVWGGGGYVWGGGLKTCIVYLSAI